MEAVSLFSSFRFRRKANTGISSGLGLDYEIPALRYASAGMTKWVIIVVSRNDSYCGRSSYSVIPVSPQANTGISSGVGLDYEIPALRFAPAGMTGCDGWFYDGRHESFRLRFHFSCYSGFAGRRIPESPVVLGSAMRFRHFATLRPEGMTEWVIIVTNAK